MGMTQAGFRASQTAWASAASTVYTPPTGISSKRTDGLRLFRQELVSQVPQMGRGHAAGGEDPNGVLPPRRAALFVVECGDLPDGKGALPGGQLLHPVHGVVVKVLMAAKDLVRGGAQGRVALHAGIGVQQNGLAILLQQKTGVSQPGELHGKSSL